MSLNGSPSHGQWRQDSSVQEEPGPITCIIITPIVPVLTLSRQQVLAGEHPRLLHGEARETRRRASDPEVGLTGTAYRSGGFARVFRS